MELLRIYKRELGQLENSKEQMNKQLATITSDREMNADLIKDKIEQVQKQRKTIKEVVLLINREGSTDMFCLQFKEKIQSLEKSLKQFIDEFHLERNKLVDQSQIEHESSQNEISKLQRALELKMKEMNKVKKLGKTILEHRAEMECLFLDALQSVKKQIVVSRLQNRKESLHAYQDRMITHQHGQNDHGRMRTFNETFQDITTHSVFRDLDENNKW